MLTMSNEYLAAIRAMGRADRLTGTLTLPDGKTTIVLSDDNIEDGSTSISWECVSGEEIEFGSIIMAQLSISIRSDISRYAFYGAKITLSYDIKIGDEEWTNVPLGEFTVAEAERKSTLVEITAYDNLLTLDADYGGKALYGTPFEIFSQICEICGLELSTTAEEFAELPNGTEKIQVDGESGCKTYRQCAKVVAQMIGCFVIADRNGAVAVKRYSKEKTVAIPRQNRFSTKMADYVCEYMGLRIASSSGEYRSYCLDRESGLELTINDAPAWDYGSKETLQARADTLLGELIQISYTPGSIAMTGDPSLECGDLLELETEDGVVDTLVTSIKWKYHGKMTVKSAGVNPYLKSQVTRKTVIQRELQSQTEENRLIFYAFTNNAAVSTSGGDSKLLAQVTFVTIKSTSAMFLAQLPISVECEDTITTKTTQTEKTISVKDVTGSTAVITDAEGNPLTLTVMDSDSVQTVTHGYVDIQIEYYLDGNLVDYELIQRCGYGKHILALFYTFDQLDANQNKVWAVRLKIIGGSGTVTVAKKAFRATITGQGLAGTQNWDGTLAFDEEIPALVMDSGMLFPTISETLYSGQQIPISNSITQDIVMQDMDILPMPKIEERVGTAIKIVQNTIPMNAAQWEHLERYCVIDENGIMARMKWEYTSEEADIDAGRMTVAKAQTDDLVSVTEVTTNRG